MIKKKKEINSKFEANITYDAIKAVVLKGKDAKYKKTTVKKEDLVLRPSYAPRKDLSFEFTTEPGINCILFYSIYLYLCFRSRFKQW
jgi:hypothetical protein